MLKSLIEISTDGSMSHYPKTLKRNNYVFIEMAWWKERLLGLRKTLLNLLSSTNNLVSENRCILNPLILTDDRCKVTRH